MQIHFPNTEEVLYYDDSSSSSIQDPTLRSLQALCEFIRQLRGVEMCRLKPAENGTLDHPKCFKVSQETAHVCMFEEEDSILTGCSTAVYVQ